MHVTGFWCKVEEMTIKYLGISTFQGVHKQVFVQGTVGESAQQQSSDVFSFETTGLKGKKKTIH